MRVKSVIPGLMFAGSLCLTQTSVQAELNDGDINIDGNTSAADILPGQQTLLDQYNLTAQQLIHGDEDVIPAGTSLIFVIDLIDVEKKFQ